MYSYIYIGFAFACIEDSVNWLNVFTDRVMRIYICDVFSRIDKDLGFISVEWNNDHDDESFSLQF